MLISGENDKGRNMFDVIIDNRLSIISVISSLVLLWFIIHNVKKERIKEAYAIIWVVMGIAFLAVSIWPNLIGRLADFFGIFYAPAILMLILIVMLIFVSIQFSIVISKQSEKIKTLTQELALLKTEQFFIIESEDSNRKKTTNFNDVGLG